VGALGALSIGLGTFGTLTKLTVILWVLRATLPGTWCLLNFGCADRFGQKLEKTGGKNYFMFI